MAYQYSSCSSCSPVFRGERVITVFGGEGVDTVFRGEEVVTVSQSPSQL